MTFKKIFKYFTFVVFLNVSCGFSGEPETNILKYEVIPIETASDRVRHAAIIGSKIIYSTYFIGQEDLQTLDNSLMAMDLPTAEILWESPLKVLGPVVGDNKNLYAVSADGISKLSVHSGEVIWTIPDVEVDLQLRTPELLLLNDLLVYSSPQRLYAFDAESGDEIWNQSTPIIQKENRLIYHGNYLYIHGLVPQIGDYQLIAVDISEGSIKWQFTFEAPVKITTASPDSFASNPIIHDDIVYYTDYFNLVLYALDNKTGDLIWQNENYILERPVIFQDSLISLEKIPQTNLLRLDPEAKELIWNQDRRNIASTLIPQDELLIIDDKVAFHSWDSNINQLILIDAESGSAVLTQDLEGSDACKIKSHILFTIQNEDLYLISPDCIHMFTTS